jgi:hypothetical protein
MKKLTLLPVFMLVTISLNGMAGRIAQYGRQVAPTLRGQIGTQRLPIPKQCPQGLRPLQQRSLFTSSRAGAQQQAGYGRTALLMGGAGAAAFAGKTAYDYFNTPEGRLLKEAAAAEGLSTEEETIADLKAKEKAKTDLIQFASDLVIKMRDQRRPLPELSEEEVTTLIDKLPELLNLSDIGNIKFIHGFGQWGSMRSHKQIESGKDFVLEILENLRKKVAYEILENNERRFYFLPLSTQNENTVMRIIDKLIDIQSSQPSSSVNVLTSIFDHFYDLRIPLLKKIIRNNTEDSDIYYLLTHEITHNILPNTYNSLFSRVQGAVANDGTHLSGRAVNKIDAQLESSRDQLLPTIVNLLIKQRPGAGIFVDRLTGGSNLCYQKKQQDAAFRLATHIAEHPELTPSLAAVYNNPAEQFDGFRKFVNGDKYYYIPGSPQADAFDAIKREAYMQKKAESARVQE